MRFRIFDIPSLVLSKIRLLRGLIKAGVIRDTVENAITFAVFLIIRYLCYRGGPIFSGIDVWAVYVCVAASSKGMLQGALAAVAACAAVSVEAYPSFYSSPSGASYCLGVVAAAVICGVLSDKMRRDRSEAVEAAARQKRESERLSSICIESERIIDEYALRIASSDRGLPYIYSIVKDIAQAPPEKIFSSAATAVSKLMDTDKVAVYRIPDKRGADAPPYVRLSASTSMKSFPRSVDMASMPRVWDKISRGQTYIKGASDGPEPMAVVPVTQGEGGAVRAAIMIDGIPFSKAQPYYSDLLATLGLLFGEHAESAIRYEDASYEADHIGGTDVLTPEAFYEAYRQTKKDELDGVSDFILLRLTKGGRCKVDGLELASSASVGLRFTDAAGLGFDGCGYLLMRGASKADAPTVINRLKKTGVYAVLANRLPRVKG